MKKLTPEEKEKRARERAEAAEQMEARAPEWYRMIEISPETDAHKVFSWITLETESGSSHISVRVVFTEPGKAPVEVSESMTIEDWARLADAALRRVKWLTQELDGLDPMVQAAMGRKEQGQ